MKKDLLKRLKKLNIPKVLIPGIAAAIILGWSGTALYKTTDFYKIKQLFPNSGVVAQIEDGDTFVLKNGRVVRLIGINAPERGLQNYTESTNYLSNQLTNHTVYLEYDRYQDDPYGRLLAWVWVDCESTPQFLPADYMYKSGNESMPGLTQNPKGCKKGKLVNEELAKSGFAVPVVYTDRGKLKYQTRLSSQKP